RRNHGPGHGIGHGARAGSLLEHERSHAPLFHAPARHPRRERTHASAQRRRYAVRARHNRRHSPGALATPKLGKVPPGYLLSVKGSPAAVARINFVSLETIAR